MKLADFNIRATPPQRTKRVEQDLELAAELGRDVYCWQELGGRKRYVRALKQQFPEGRWMHLFERKRNIITVSRAKYARVQSMSVELSPPDRRLPQPRRLANAALLRDLDNGKLAWVVNFHLTNGAWNKRWFPAWNKKLRRKRWIQEAGALQDLVHELRRVANVPVWLCADSNSKRMPKLDHLQVDVVSAAPMHISVVNPAGPVSGRRIPAAELNTDHDGLVARG